METDFALLGEHKLWASEALCRIDRALRQEKRLRRSFRRLQKEGDREFARHTSGATILMPLSYSRLSVLYEDEVYFFVVACRQALSTVKVMRTFDPGFPEIRQSAPITHWRDIYEHWDDPAARGIEIRAAAKWQEVSRDSEPGLTTGAKGNNLTQLSGVKLKRLRKDLKSARVAAFAIEDRIFHQLHVTPEVAADILGIRVEEVAALPLQSFPEWDEYGGGRLYHRESVEHYLNTGSGHPPRWDQLLS